MNTLYPYKHWILTLVTAPVIIFLWYFFEEGGDIMYGLSVGLPLSIIFGALFSTPALILYVIIFNIVPYKKVSLVILKWIFNGLIIICIFLLNYLLNGAPVSSFTIVYSIAVIVSSLFLKMHNTDETPVGENYLVDKDENNL